ncbi:MAG: carbonic anhydrase [Candidatus Anammoximicrobium sp.]|nr:carbonic anhydrase [Candidatus Anammoximicrobium sp.]
MQQLVQGVHHFQKIGFREREELFARLQHGQEPEACLITCADSRIVPNLITNSEPGQLFIVRNVGNLVPCYGTSNNDELAAVEYAVVELGVEDVIVCGHTGCGAMQALINSLEASGPSRTPLVMNWLRHADATLEIVREHYGHLQGKALVNAAAEENVLVQLEHLRTLPVIASRISSGRVRLHGWMYKIDTGEVFYYESETGQFVKFGDATVIGGAGAAVAGRKRA